ncbi:MAG: hypothetical protein KIT87_02525 [Anaerolineae bacterium]|nr:hypothetical protein [Anaerolineae bacterium]
MQHAILQLEKFLAMIFALFFVVASVLIFGFGLAHAGQALLAAEKSVDPLFTAVALVAIAVAVLELGATILAEEMARSDPKREPTEIRRTLSRFLYIVITALAIEGLLMVFKYSIGDQPVLLIYAGAVLVATSVLLIAIAIYNRFSLTVEVEEANNPALVPDETGKVSAAHAQD